MSKATKKTAKASGKATKKTSKPAEIPSAEPELQKTIPNNKSEQEPSQKEIVEDASKNPVDEIQTLAVAETEQKKQIQDQPAQPDAPAPKLDSQSERDAILASLKEMSIDVSSLSAEELNQLIEEYKEMKSFESSESEEIEKAIEEVKQESEIDKLARELEGDLEPKKEESPNIEDEIDKKIEQELERKKKKKEKEVMTEDKFIEYLKSRRSKIVYFALWELAMKIDDHQSTKQGLYERLKDVTSTDPIDPINEHKFYFGLGYILRLKLYESPVVVFKAGKLKLNVNVDNLKKMLEQIGEPISTRPVIPEEKKKKMIDDFFSDAFNDI
jgi:hypothetical protein